MRALTKAEVIEYLSWFENMGSEYPHSDAEGLFFTDPEARCIDLEYPKPDRLPWFVRFLAAIGYEDKDFEGALVWFTGWGVWNSSDEGVGYRIVDAMHRAAGQPGSFETAPGNVFRADELPDAIAMLMQPMVFGFDAYYLPKWSYGTGQFFVFVSHDSYVNIITRTKEFYDKIFSLLKELDLSPRPSSEARILRFCRPSPKREDAVQ